MFALYLGTNTFISLSFASLLKIPYMRKHFKIPANTTTVAASGAIPSGTVSILPCVRVYGFRSFSFGVSACHVIVWTLRRLLFSCSPCTCAHTYHHLDTTRVCSAQETKKGGDRHYFAQETELKSGCIVKTHLLTTKLQTIFLLFLGC
jgi:hypothetical protein